MERAARSFLFRRSSAGRVAQRAIGAVAWPRMEDLKSQSATVVGTVERITYHNPDNGFSVLRVAVDQQSDLATVVGEIPSVASGEYIEAHGMWVNDPKFGEQFRATMIRTAHPASPEGIRKYLGSGMVKGIGPQLAGRLVDAFGVQVFDIIDRDPQRLREVDGIGAERVKRILKSWNQQRAIRGIMLFLQEHGLGIARATRIYKTYGDEAVQRIKQNPYQLVEDIRGIGFQVADELADRLGIERDSDLRARAGVAFVLSELGREGHCAFPEDELIERARVLLDVDEGIVCSAVEHGVRRDRLVRDSVDGESWIYLAHLYHAEWSLARKMLELLGGRHPLPAIDTPKALDWVEARVGLELAEAQRRAVVLACTEKVMIITGGPGVGKTTIVDSILKIFLAKNLKCALCAPTGRAAKRLTEATGCDARTIHRMLEYDPATGSFRYNESRPLKADVVLIDEVSMLDLTLACHVVRAVPPHAALILVGDIDQLPSVGPGSVLGDLIASERIPTVRLTEIYRQAGSSRIVTAAHQINSGEVPELRSPSESSDFYFAQAMEPEAALDVIVEIVTRRIPEKFGFDPLRDVQILTPMHRGVLGSRNLNQTLQAVLNPPARDKPELERFGFCFRVGDRVLQTENDYDKDVFNGDLGTIVDVDPDEPTIGVRFDNRLVGYEAGDFDALLPAYAMTVHKSQGSEFPVVVMPVHTQHYIMLQRNLLYTGVTRGKQLVVLVGAPRAVQIAVSQNIAARRYSALKHRLMAGSPLAQS